MAIATNWPKAKFHSLRDHLCQALVRRARRRGAGLRQNTIDVQRLASRPGARIVVVVRDHLGGMMAAVPVLRALRQQYPRSSITVLTNKYALPAMQRCPYVDRAFGFYRLNGDGHGHGIRRIWNAIEKAWILAHLVGRIDISLHLRKVGGATLLLHELLGAKVQIGYHQDGFSELLSIDLGQQRPGLSLREWNIEELRPFGLEGVSQDLEVWTSAEDEFAVDRLLHTLYGPGEPRFACFHPGAHWGCNQWLPERWAALGDELYRRRGLRTVITGSADETAPAHSIAAMMVYKPLVATGRTSFSQLAALFRRSDVVVAVDTLPRQLCQALKQRGVILFGAGDPAWFAPLPSEPMIVLSRNTGIVHVDMTRPTCETWKGTCHNPDCDVRPLRVVEVADAIVAVEQLLDAAVSVRAGVEGRRE